MSSCKLQSTSTMKTLSLLMLFVAASAFSQGQVNFNNSPAIFADSATVDRFVYADHVGGAKLSGTNWAAQLYYGSGHATPESALVPLTAAAARFYPTNVFTRFGWWS